MKKLLSIVAAIGLSSTTATSVVACGGGETFELVFIPSKAGTEVINTVKPLEQQLQNKLSQKAEARGGSFKKKVKVSVSSNYEAGASVLTAGKADISFLPIGTYNSFKGNKRADGTYDKLGILAQASRQGMKTEVETNLDSKAEYDEKDSLLVATKYNESFSNIDEITNKTSLDKIYKSDEQVTYYRSYIYINNEYLKSMEEKVGKIEEWNNNNYVKNVKTLINESKKGFTFGKSKTSGASSIFPLMWLKNTIGYPEAELEKLYSNSKKQTDYNNAAEGVENGTYDFAVGFSDIRADLKDDKSTTTINRAKSAIKNSRVIGVGDKIINDGIIYSRKRNNSVELLNDVRQAFKELISKEENKEIFKIYSHTDYSIPKDIASSNEWEAQNDKDIASVSEKSDAMLKQIQNWN
ncbi:PhnD/SsuA/transferrin family substrate-binding protein [Mesoplasma corruscae]|uniref:Phosphonate transport system substrate-binding protein n=1 Tax=Mesoplasma corruscae TaxID=216874 RepID=A0A2S5RG83_9MOLU|nr:PhnD/SsuA/transferrin family substrate-binding protein [Mesoplasma corruscae]PPE06344.1 phosphonate transport system substrate-binding protein [Mesoplasma corruscae]